MVRRISTHPRQLWWVMFDETTELYGLCDAWKGEVATSSSIESIDAAAGLLCDVPLRDWPLYSQTRQEFAFSERRRGAC